MEKNTNAVEVFHQFAEDKLKNHFEELQIRYRNEKIDKELLQQAYEQHHKIYSQELDDKIQSLLTNDNNEWLKGELENLKHIYETKLSLSQQ